MRVLSSFAVIFSCSICFEPILAHTPAQKSETPSLHISNTSYHHEKSEPPSSKLQKRGPAPSKEGGKAERAPSTNPRIISVANLPSPAIPILGSGSQSRRTSSSSHRRVSGESLAAGPTPFQRPSSLSLSDSGARPPRPASRPDLKSSPPERYSPMTQRASQGSSSSGSRKTFERPEPGTYPNIIMNSGPGFSRTPSQSPTRSDHVSDKDKSPTMSDTISPRSPSGKSDPAKTNIDRGSAAKPKQASWRPSPGTSPKHEAFHSPVAAIGRKPSLPPIKTKLTIEDLSPLRSSRSARPNTVYTRPPPAVSLESTPSSSPRQAFTQPPARHSPKSDTTQRPSPIVPKMPSLPPLSTDQLSKPIYTSRTFPHTPPVKPPSLPPISAKQLNKPIHQPRPSSSSSTQSTQSIQPAHIFKNSPPRAAYSSSASSRHQTTTPIASSLEFKPPNLPPIKTKPDTKPNSPSLPSTKATQPTSEALMRANKATSNFYARLGKLPPSSDPVQNNKQARWGLLSKVHGVASDFYAQNPKPSHNLKIPGDTVPALLEAPPDPKQHAMHTERAAFYNRLANWQSRGEGADPASARKLDQYQLLAKYHGAASAYYDAPK